MFTLLSKVITKFVQIVAFSKILLNFHINAFQKFIYWYLVFKTEKFVEMETI
jgi:hypothetical protein